LKISIITPSYNQEHFLEATIRSVLDQNYPNFEYVIIDGGSTDGSVEIIKKYERYLAYWVSEKDRGQSHAINKGLELVSGDIIAWINSDDVYMPDAFKKVVEAFRQKADADVLYGDGVLIDKEGQQIKCRPGISFRYKIWLYGVAEPFQPEVFYRREAVKRAGLLDESFHMMMDREWWLRMARSGCTFVHIPEPLAGLRVYDERKSNSQRKLNELERWRIHDIYWEGFRFRNVTLHKLHWTILLYYYRLYRQLLKVKERKTIDWFH
jgi:glycosyltransferase involved in cell wall biosynthesis